MLTVEKPLTARGWRDDGCMKPALRKMLGYPRRQAVRYNGQECADIMAQEEQGFNCTEIAEWHERTPYGIMMMLDRMHGRY